MNEKNEGADVDSKTMTALITSGDMAGLTPEQKIIYYKSRCEAAGLDPRTAPFQFIRLQGKETLYATKGATDQLTKLHKITVEVIEQKTEQDIRMVMVRATTADGRRTDEMGAIPIKGLSGADLANAYMKTITKAKRRAVLSLCGLGMMDELELETISGVTRAPEIEMPKPLPAGSPVPFQYLPPMEATSTTSVVGLKQLDDDALDGNTNPDHAEMPLELVVVPKKIIAEKNPDSAGYIYHVYGMDDSMYTTKTKSLAVIINNAVKEGKKINMTILGNMIEKVKMVPDVP